MRNLVGVVVEVKGKVRRSEKVGRRFLAFSVYYSVLLLTTKENTR